MTVVDVVSRLGLELDQALEKLNGRGVEAEAEARIRDLAKKDNLSPHDLVKIMRE